MTMNDVREMLNNMNDAELREIVEMVLGCEHEYGHNDLGKEFDEKMEKLYRAF